MGDDGTEGNPDVLASLFTVTTKKAAPQYDYSIVPSRVMPESKDDDSDDEEGPGLTKKKKKEKTGKRGARKRAEAEAKAAASNDGTTATEGNGDATAAENGGAPSQEALFKKANDAKNEAKLKEALEVQRQDRMAQVKAEDSKERKEDPEKEARTVFVGNLPVTCKKQELKKIFMEFGKIEAIRFRCATRPDLKTTKKVAVIKGKFHEESSNIAAYVRFTEVEMAVKATAFNGSLLEGHSVRVDLAAAARSHDNKRAVFLGNLDFKVQEDEVRALFAKCGEVESVRLVRDASTGIGKGFGYVNFAAVESVELALRMANQEVGGRKIRVNRAVRKAKPGKVMESKKSMKVKKAKHLRLTKGQSNRRSQGQIKRTNGFKKAKEEVKSFQGVSTSTEKPKKRKVNKTEKRNKILAQKLAA